MSGAPAPPSKSVQQLIEICVKSANESSARLKKLQCAASIMKRSGLDDLGKFQAEMAGLLKPADAWTAADYDAWALDAAAMDLERRRRVNFGIAALGAATVAVEDILGRGA